MSSFEETKCDFGDDPDDSYEIGPLDMAVEDSEQYEADGSMVVLSRYVFL